MSETNPDDGLSRRKMLLGLGAAAGVGATLAALPGFAGAQAPTFAPQTATLATPEALGAAIAGLTYLNIDAQAFWPTFFGAGAANQRVYQDATGSQPITPNDRIWAPLPIPVGSVIFQISASYQTQPILEISKRPMVSGVPAVAPVQVFQSNGTQIPASPGGPFAATVNLPTPVTIEANSTYTVSAFCTAGSSVLGVSIGYRPPTQGFIPFTGANPRVLDTREGGLTKFGIGEQRKINLGLAGARSGVFNLTVVNTEGNAGGLPPGGFLSAFAGDTFPGNSSVNWDHPGQISANLVISALDAAGNVTLRGNVNKTDVVVDVIGYMI